MYMTVEKSIYLCTYTHTHIYIYIYIYVEYVGRVCVKANSIVRLLIG